jgi:lipid-A-disaccharide synthase
VTSPRLSEPSPRSAVRRELRHALGQLALAPLRALDFAVQRAALRDELAALLDDPAPVDPPPHIGPLPDEPLRVFLSCAEASGEIHAVNFVRAFERECAERGAPRPRWFGLGGERVRAAGVELIEDLVAKATMGFDGIARALPFYLDVLTRCAARIQSERPDVVVLIDSPALHAPLGRIARRYGARVVHFVTPQHWAWAPWRTPSYTGAVDRALSILPFEKRWFERRGVDVVHVGHPLLDQLPVQVARRASTPPRLALLPGSRSRVIELNLPWMLAVAAALRERRPELQVVVAHGDERRRHELEEHVAGARASAWARVEIGDLHATLATSRAAVSVSGTVLLDLLHLRLPTVCIYRVASRRDVALHRWMLATPYFASVNLLAGREVFPEHCFRGQGPRELVAEQLEARMFDSDVRRAVQRGMDAAAQRLGPPGACRRAALVALDQAMYRARANSPR